VCVCVCVCIGVCVCVCVCVYVCVCVCLPRSDWSSSVSAASCEDVSCSDSFFSSELWELHVTVTVWPRTHTHTHRHRHTDTYTHTHTHTHTCAHTHTYPLPSLLQDQVTSLHLCFLPGVLVTSRLIGSIGPGPGSWVLGSDEPFGHNGAGLVQQGIVSSICFIYYIYMNKYKYIYIFIYI